MPPKKATAGNDADSPIGLTDGELRFIKAVFDNMTQKPDANWDQVADDLGLKDAKCAKERFRQMSVRHGWRDGAAVASPRKRNGGATGPSGDGRVKKTRSPRKKAPKREPTDDDDDDSKPGVKVDEDETEPDLEV